MYFFLLYGSKVEYMTHIVREDQSYPVIDAFTLKPQGDKYKLNM